MIDPSRGMPQHSALRSPREGPCVGGGARSVELRTPSNEGTLTATATRRPSAATSPGFGADEIIIDDPVQPEDALSERVKQQLRDWVNSSVYTRFNDPSQGTRACARGRQFDPRDELCAPIPVGKDNLVIDGAVRVQAARHLGLGRAP